MSKKWVLKIVLQAMGDVISPYKARVECVDTIANINDCARQHY